MSKLLGNKKIVSLVAGVGVLSILAFSLLAQNHNTIGNVEAQQVTGKYTGDPTTKPAISPPFQKVKVYIFPRDVHKFQVADELAADIRQIAGIRLAMDAGPDSGASKQGIYDRDGNLIIRNATATEFYISPDLKKPDGSAVTVDDLIDSMSYGNGLAIADIAIKPKNVGDDHISIPAIWFVVGEPDVPAADAKIGLIKATIENHISSEAAHRALYG